VARADLITLYATALLEVADAEEALDRVAGELFGFAKALEQNHELRNALTDIALPDDRKKAIIEELLGARSSEHARHMIGFIVAQGRGRDLPDIVEAFNKQAAERTSKIVAEVRSAIPLDDAQRAKLADALSAATGKSVEVKTIVDTSVLGGVYAKVGDQVIDGTVRRRLQEIEEAIQSS
jgi:F-type H+-transporting ATPase subunit delta